MAPRVHTPPALAERSASIVCEINEWKRWVAKTGTGVILPGNRREIRQFELLTWRTSLLLSPLLKFGADENLFAEKQFGRPKMARYRCRRRRAWPPRRASR